MSLKISKTNKCKKYLKFEIFAPYRFHRNVIFRIMYPKIHHKIRFNYTLDAQTTSAGAN
jgi:hypothetical protein